MNKPPFSLRKALARLCDIHVAIVGWAIVPNFGFAGLLAYATRPGIEAASPVVRPIFSGIARDPSRPTLLALERSAK